MQGAFYVLPEMSAFFGPGVQAKDFGPIGDVDTLCMYLITKAHVSSGKHGPAKMDVRMNACYCSI